MQKVEKCNIFLFVSKKTTLILKKKIFPYYDGRSRKRLPTKGSLLFGIEKPLYLFHFALYLIHRFLCFIFTVFGIFFIILPEFL